MKHESKNPASALVAAACRTIESAEESPPLAALAKAAGLSAFHFHRVFKAVAGVTPKAYAVAVRARRVRDGLPGSGSVTEAYHGAGFGSSGRFYAKSAETLGMKPSSFRDGGKGATIKFAVGQCALGAILIAASEKGVCALTLGGDPGALVKEFQDRFPKARLVGGDKRFEGLVARAVAFVESPRVGLDLPLDVRGTAFQQRVWRALRRSRSARPRATRRSRGASERRRARAPSRARARRTRSASRSRAIASCAPTARCRATAGAWSASARCSSARNSQIVHDVPAP